MKNKTVQIILTLVFSVVALYLALRGVKFQEVSAAFAQVRWGWVVVTEALILVTLIIRAARWRVLLGEKISLRDSFGLIAIGYLVSGVLPLRAGDPARAVGASMRPAGARGPVSVIAALSTVVVERVLDMLIIVIILLGTLPFVSGLRQYLASGQSSQGLSLNLLLGVSGLLALVMTVAFILVALFPRRVELAVQQTLERLHVPQPERWLRPLHNIFEGLSALSSPRAGAALAGWSVALWVSTIAYFYTTMIACQDFVAAPSPLKSTVATWASAFGMIFPAQGGLGSFHFAVREALFWGFAVARDAGFTYAVILHAMPYVTGILLGAVTLLVWGVSLKSLISQS